MRFGNTNRPVHLISCRTRPCVRVYGQGGHVIHYGCRPAKNALRPHRDRIASHLIHQVDGIFQAICKHVLVQKAITGLHISIPIDKPTRLRVIVAGLEVIQPQIGIVVIPPVPYRVDVADEAGRSLCNSRRVGHGEHLSPRVVGVFRHRVGVSVDDGDYIPLQVVPVVVLRSVVGKADPPAVCVKFIKASALLSFESKAMGLYFSKKTKYVYLCKY